MNLESSVKRFIFGIGIGIFIAMIAWSYSAYYHVSISLMQGILTTLFLGVTCGLVATIGSLDKLMDNLPFL
ncbi:MAG: hypothetical protein QNJ63_14520 [Calothrix sp. MO_192.B10]|nr:hypothetical protein [Calothrix sp. MO_192.B10]